MMKSASAVVALLYVSILLCLNSTAVIAAQKTPSQSLGGGSDKPQTSAIEPGALTKDGFPSNLQEEAKKTFADGKPYFIWTTDTQPIKGSVTPIGSVFGLKNLKVISASSSQTPRFRVQIALESIVKNTNKTITSVFTLPDNPEDAKSYKANFSYETVFIAGRNLKGAGLARIWLIPQYGKTDGAAVPISNTTVVAVTF